MRAAFWLAADCGCAVGAAEGAGAGAAGAAFIDCACSAAAADCGCGCAGLGLESVMAEAEPGPHNTASIHSSTAPTAPHARIQSRRRSALSVGTRPPTGRGAPLWTLAWDMMSFLRISAQATRLNDRDVAAGTMRGGETSAPPRRPHATRSISSGTRSGHWFPTRPTYALHQARSTGCDASPFPSGVTRRRRRDRRTRRDCWPGWRCRR